MPDKLPTGFSWTISSRTKQPLSVPCEVRESNGTFRAYFSTSSCSRGKSCLLPKWGNVLFSKAELGSWSLLPWSCSLSEFPHNLFHCHYPHHWHWLPIWPSDMRKTPGSTMHAWTSSLFKPSSDLNSLPRPYPTTAFLCFHAFFHTNHIPRE